MVDGRRVARGPRGVQRVARRKGHAVGGQRVARDAIYGLQRCFAIISPVINNLNRHHRNHLTRHRSCAAASHRNQPLCTTAS